MSENYEWDVRCADVELSRLEGGFTGEDFVNFTRVAYLAYTTVVNDIHIETGSLKSSARLDLETMTPHVWSAEISVGGDSTGVKPIVRYAAAEFFGSSPRHGGPPSHSYFKRVGWTPDRFGGNFGSGVPIEDDLAGPASSFISRGRRTPHPERGGL